MSNTHRGEVLRLLIKQIGNQEEVDGIDKTASEVAGHWIKPLGGGAPQQTNGLIYGLVQSGKTGVLTLSGALGADEGYRTVIILTSDIDPLYLQTLGRIQEAFPGIDVIGKSDLKDDAAFIGRIKSGTCAIVITKNSSLLGTLNENFQKGRVPGLSCLIIDDEADQASLNTKAAKGDGSTSAINDRIANLRGFFDKSTYLQVTATPQALFLQPAGHDFRPKFTVLSHPGKGYVGGEDFFGETADLVREFDLNEMDDLVAGAQPKAGSGIPKSLLRALDTFMVGATYKRSKDADQNCAFLCHVSTRTSDHDHIVALLRKYKTTLAAGAKNRDRAVLSRLRIAYDDLATSHPGIAETEFDDLVESIGFLSPGIHVKMVNGQTDEDVAVRSPYNLFVGGNKLGRGVTIKNLLVSYYGRNPKSPQADTVLQHARMYGYRRNDIGLLRLFLPPELHKVFKAIHRMEGSLRDLIDREPGEEFRGVYVETGVSPTRKNVLVPGAVGIYTAGGGYNPAQIVRDPSIRKQTLQLDELLSGRISKSISSVSLEDLVPLIQLCVPDAKALEHVWHADAVIGSMRQYSKLFKEAGAYLWIDRNRGLQGPRRETQGILDSAEYKKLPTDKFVLCLLRVQSDPKDEPAWWPEIRFPKGRYAFAFAL